MSRQLLSTNVKPRTLTEFLKEEVSITKEKMQSGVVSEENYLQLGIVAFGFGVDSFLKPLSAEQVVLIKSRLENFSITKEKFLDVCEYVKTITDESVLEQSKLFIDKIKENIDVPEKVQKEITNCINGSKFPITFAKDLQENLVKKSQMTYEQVLLFNKFIFDDCQFRIGELKKSLSFLYQDDFFSNSMLAEAIARLDLKKNIYPLNESILVFANDVRSGSVVSKFIEVFDYTEEQLKGEFVQEFKQEVPPTIPLNQEAQNTETPAQEGNPFTRPYTTYMSIFDNINNQRKLTGEKPLEPLSSIKDMETAIQHLFEDEENISAFYMFNIKMFELISNLKAKNVEDDINIFKSEIEKLFGDVKEYNQKLFDELIAPRQVEYNEIIAGFVEELSLDKQNEIWQIINNTIEVLIVSSKEDKALLLGQMDENVIFTTKHLSQMLEVINRQEIYGEDIKLVLKNEERLNEALDGGLEKLISNTQTLENLQLQIKVFTSIYNVLKLAY